MWQSILQEWAKTGFLEHILFLDRGGETPDIGGLLSLMFAGGPLFEGMATVMVVGLIFGTVLTLFVLPALIAVFVEDFGLNLTALPESSNEANNVSKD